MSQSYVSEVNHSPAWSTLRLQMGQTAFYPLTFSLSRHVLREKNCKLRPDRRRNMDFKGCFAILRSIKCTAFKQKPPVATECVSNLDTSLQKQNCTWTDLMILVTKKVFEDVFGRDALQRRCLCRLQLLIPQSCLVTKGAGSKSNIHQRVSIDNSIQAIPLQFQCRLIGSASTRRMNSSG